MSYARDNLSGGYVSVLDIVDITKMLSCAVQPYSAAGQGEQAEQGQQDPQRQQGEHVEEGVHAQEEAEDQYEIPLFTVSYFFIIPSTKLISV